MSPDRLNRPAAARALALSALFLSAAFSGCGKDKDKPDKKPQPEYKGPKVTLEIKFTPGEYVLTEEVNTSTDITGQGQPSGNKQTMLVSGDVTIGQPKASGEQEITMVCRRIKQTVEVAQGQRRKTMAYDSAEPAETQDRQLAQALGALIGWEAALTVDKDGKFVKLDGLQPLVAKIGARTNRQVARQVEKMLEPFLKELLTKHWGEMIPTEPVGPGDSWQKNIKMDFVPMLGDMTFECAAELQDIKTAGGSRRAVIPFGVTTTVKNRALDLPVPGTATLDELALDISGTAYFDMDIGLATQLSLAMDGTGRLTVRAGGESQTADMAIKATYESRLKKKPGSGGRPTQDRPTGAARPAPDSPAGAGAPTTAPAGSAVRP